MTRHHVIISGTGRAGTTFLVQLLTTLGLDTGFSDIKSSTLESCHAGMEWDIQKKNSPYIIKSPWLCDNLENVINQGVIIDYAIIPVRDLYSAAESRRFVTRKSSIPLGSKNIPGGLWHTTDPDKQEIILAQQLYKIIHAIVKYEIPLQFLYFPRLVHDPLYLYSKLKFILKDISYEIFLVSFNQVSRPELVHDFTLEKQITGFKLI